MIRFAFYKPQDFFGWMIAGWTKIFNPSVPAYCHVEIGFFVDNEWRWYSSVSRNADGSSGTRWITKAELFKHPERWDVYDVKPARDMWEMIDTCDKEVGKKYDWAGIAGFVTLFGQLNQKDKWYCSEICHYVFFGKWEKRVSPERLYHEILTYIVD